MMNDTQQLGNVEEADFTEEVLREKYHYKPKKDQSLVETLKSKLQCNANCLKDFIFRLFPILSWLPKYPLKRYALGDVVAGLTISVVRIPQGLAYGLLAGLYPINGLYTGFFSPLVYLIFGTSRHISVGVFSIISLMLGSALDKLSIDPLVYFPAPSGITSTPLGITSSTENSATTDVMPYLDATTSSSSHETIAMTDEVQGGYTDEQNLAIIGSLTVLIGIFLVVLGILHLGAVTVFLSDPLVSGFTTGAALYVVTAQMKYVTGITLPRGSGVFGLIKTWVQLLSHLYEIQWASMVVSIVCLLLLVPIKHVNRTYKKKLKNIPIPVELMVVILGTGISYGIGLNENYGVKIVGLVPSGMPTPNLPMVSLWPVLIPDAISIGIVMFAIAVSLGKMFGKKHGYQIDPNQELLAIGLCQITNGIFQGHAGGGALARSTVQESSGGNTQIAGLISSSILLLVLLVIGPLFQCLPLACLACIILANLHGLLVQFERLPQLWRIDKYDFSIWLITFTAVVLLGIDLGLAVGIIASLCIGALRTNRITIKELGVLPDSTIYRELGSYQDLATFPHIKIVQFPESPSYANKSVLQNLSTDILALNNGDGSIDTDSDEMTSVLPKHGGNIKVVILDCSLWSDIDTVGLSTLKQVIAELNVKEIAVYFSCVQENVYIKICASDMLRNEDPQVNVYPTISFAVNAANRSVDKSSVVSVV